MNTVETKGLLSNKIICGITTFTIAKEWIRRGGATIRSAIDKFLKNPESEYAPFPTEIIYFGRPSDIHELAKAFKS